MIDPGLNKYFTSLLKLLLITAGVHISLISFSQDIDNEKTVKSDTATFTNRLDKINAKMEKVVKYSPLPIVSYSSETSWMFGLTKYNGFRIGANGTNDSTIQPSHITSLAYFTLNNQFKIGTEIDLMFGENKYRSRTQIYYLDFPDYYYGVGDNTELKNQRLVKSKNLDISQGFEYNISKEYYIGIYYQYNNYYVLDYEDTLNYDNKLDLEPNEGLQSGLGVNFARETRDNRFNASKGSYLFIKYLNYGKWIGSNFEYNLFIADYRNYFTLHKFLTIATQIYTEGRFGNVPIQSLSLMGGDNRMRGLYLGRYRDHTIIDGQVELRFPIAWIIGGTTFAGLGEVAPDYGSYTFEGLRWSAGAGLRLMVDSKSKTNLRFDIGFSKDRTLFFFTFLEAF
jgi:hypothetical protein